MATPANAPYKMKQRVTVAPRVVYPQGPRGARGNSPFTRAGQATRPRGKSAIRAAKKARRLARAV